jgi:hypothetical protein
MPTSPSPLHRLFALLLLAPATFAQTSTIVVMPTPLAWQDAYTRCQQLGRTIYPVPATPTDPVYAVLAQQAGDRYWIARRAGGSCTCLNKDGAGDLLEEAPCGDLLPAFCGS